jgi:hypothetical protein
MNYKDIATFQQRMKDSKPTSEAEMHVVLHEEIAELRHYIEWYLMPKDNWAYPTNNNAS